MAKYMLIMRGTDESVAKMMETPFEQMLETVGRFNEEMIRAGVLVAAEGLDDPTQGVVVDFSGETPVVTDGPYGETKELFGGFYVIDVASTDHAGEEDDRRGGSAVRAAAVRGTAAAARRCPQRAYTIFMEGTEDTVEDAHIVHTRPAQQPPRPGRGQIEGKGHSGRRLDGRRGAVNQAPVPFPLVAWNSSADLVSRGSQGPR